MKKSNKAVAMIAAVPSTVNNLPATLQAIEKICFEYHEDEVVSLLQDMYLKSLLGREGEQLLDEKPGTTYLFVQQLTNLIPELFTLYTRMPELFLEEVTELPGKVLGFSALWRSIEVICMSYSDRTAIDILADLYLKSLLGRERNQQLDSKPATTYLLFRYSQRLMVELFTFYTQHPELFETGKKAA